MINVCLFVRVSTDKQDYDRQISELTEYVKSKGWAVGRVIATQVSGGKPLKKRPDIDELFEAAEAGEFQKVLVIELSRISRIARDFRDIVYRLHDMGISIIFKNLGGLESLDENGKESFVGNIMMAIYSELAQEERRLISERVKSGMQHAKSKGKQIGRKKGYVKGKEKIYEEYSELIESLKNGLSIRKCIETHGVSKGTVIKVKKILEQDEVL